MPEPLPPAPPPDFDRAIAVIEELRRQYDPKRSAAERAGREALVAKYPGQFVAYLDDWDGERLTRQVLAASRSIAEVHAALRTRSDIEAIRRQCLSLVVCGAGTFRSCPGCWVFDFGPLITHTNSVRMNKSLSPTQPGRYQASQGFL